jgi:hypothetical protein
MGKIYFTKKWWGRRLGCHLLGKHRRDACATICDSDSNSHLHNFPLSDF